MLSVEYRLKLGQDEFVIKADVKNEKEFFEKMAFYSSLPKTAPGGATDLKLVVRTTKKGTYYSLISETEKVEFQLGQHKEGGTLYPKEWIPLYQAEQEQGAAVPFGSQETQQTHNKQAPVPFGATQNAAPHGYGTIPQQPQVAPTQQVNVPVSVPTTNPVFPGMVNPVTGPNATTQAVPAAPVQPQNAGQPAVNPNIQNMANNVLARFKMNPAQNKG
jgi:hypothetical protein